MSDDAGSPEKSFNKLREQTDLTVGFQRLLAAYKEAPVESLMQTDRITLLVKYCGADSIAPIPSDQELDEIVRRRMEELDKMEIAVARIGATIKRTEIRPLEILYEAIKADRVASCLNKLNEPGSSK